jgi:hypothetical protein
MVFKLPSLLRLMLVLKKIILCKRWIKNNCSKLFKNSDLMNSCFENDYKMCENYKDH